MICITWLKRKEDKVTCEYCTKKAKGFIVLRAGIAGDLCRSAACGECEDTFGLPIYTTKECDNMGAHD